MSFGDTIAQTVLGKPTVPEDTDNAPNVIAEGAAVNTSVGITAHSTFAGGNAGLTYSLSADSSAGGFKIDPNTGVVTVADPSKIDFETSPGHVYTITVEATKNSQFSSEQTFTISVTDVAPSTPVDSNAAANTVAEGAAAGTTVGITASSTDVNGPAVTWSLTGDTSGGGFTINPTTGVITVADGTKIDFESTAPTHTYTVTATASDGTLTSSHAFTINVSDVALPTPVDTDAAANSVAEGAANGSTVGVTASAVDPNGPATTYSLTGDTSGGGFTINAATGVVTVADSTKIDYESSPGHAYTITVQANDGLQTTSQSFTIGVSDVAPSTPTDSNAAGNTVAEGAVSGTLVGITAFSTDVNGPAVTYSLTGDTSGGGFTINAVTGVISVANSTKIDYETAPGHAYTVTAQASDGTLTSSQTFTIAVSDVAPSTPTDSNAAGNSVAEGAANGTAVGITASSTDINGPAVTYSLIGDTTSGGYTINSVTGVVTVADGTKIDYESAPGHSDIINVQASDGTQTSSQFFTIAVTNVAPSQPVDSNAAANTVAEGAAANTTVGVTASSTDVSGGTVTYAVGIDSSGGGFKIDATTGVISVADPTKIDYETAPGHAYTVSVVATDGTNPSTGQTFTINVTDVAPSTPVDSDGATNTVVEGAANGTAVGITASSTDVNGPAVTYSLTGDTSGGGFFIDPSTGVVRVLDPTKIDFESSGGSYTVTAQASDGQGGTSSQTFTIAVTDVTPSTPVDGDGSLNTVLEGAANGSTVGVTASSTDINGPAVTYSLIGDTSGGGFTINASTGVVTVADGTKINYESAPGHAYTVTAQASDGTQASSQTFTIGVTNAPPSTPVDGNGAANTVVEGAANGTTVGITASSTDVNGPAVTWSLTGDTSGGGFTINAATGVVTVADSTKVDFESSGGSYTVTAQASDGQGGTSSQAFVIAVTDAPPSTPVDSDPAVNQVAVSAPAGSHVGVTASSTDINGPAVTYSLTGDTSGGGFTINASTGVVTVADPSKINIAASSYDIIVDSSDGTLHSQQTFNIAVVLDASPVVTAGHTLNYTENQAATAIDPAVTVTDSDNANLAHATVQITGNYVNGEDVLSFVNTASITGSFDTASGTLTLSGSDTVANYQTALESVKYFNTSDNPSGAARTVTIIANDGTLDSAAVTDTINVTPVNDAPVVTAGHTLNYTENQAATAFDPALTVTDVDSTNLASATVQITGNYANGQDVLAFTNQNGITGVFTPGTGTMTLTGSSSVANYQTALDSITYVNSSENPSGLARTVTIITNDGAANSVAATDTINVTPVNDAPVTTAGGTLNYTENQAATAIDASVTVTDVDNANMASATVAIGTGFATGQDVLDANVTGTTIGKSYNAATGVLTLTGSDTKAHYQQVLDSVSYFNSSDNPSGADRTVGYTVNDGALNSNTSTSTIHVTPVNDAPVVTAGAINGFTEPPNGTPAANSVPVTIAPSLAVSDVDSSNLTQATFVLNNLKPSDALSVSGHAGASGDIGSIHFAITNTATTETVTLTGTDTIAHYNSVLDLVQFNNTSENPDTTARSYTITAVDDGTGTNTGSTTTSQTITAVNDAPVNTVPVELDAIFSRTATAITGLSVSDVDGGAGETTVLSVAHGTLNVATVGGGAAVTSNGTAAVTLTGTPAEISTTLAATNGVLYTSGAFTGTDVLTVTTNDNGATGTGAHPNVISTENLGVIPKVWFIDDSASAVANSANIGTQADPFTSLASFNAATTGANDFVYLLTGTGTYTGGIVLQDGQTLIGQGDALTFPDPLHAGTLTIENAGTAPKIAPGAGVIGIDLAVGNTIHGLNVDTGANTTAIAIDDGSAANSVGNLSISHLNILGSGKAVDIDHGGGTLAVTIDSLTSSGSTTQGVNLGGAMGGSFNINAGAISGSSGVAFNVSGGSVSIDDKGTIAKTSAGQVIDIVNHNTAANTVTFEGAVSSNSGGGGINLTGNTNATMSFTGGMTLSTGASAGFVATGGGTVDVTGTNHLTTTTGTALNVSNTTIGASELTFHDISSNGASSGIILNTTGTTGGLNVTGDNTTARDGTGGTITGSTGNGISLTSTSQVSLEHMNINNSGTNGIAGSLVNGFVLDYDSLSSNGNAVNEGGIRLGGTLDTDPTGLTGGTIGSATETRIDHTLITGSFEHGLVVENTSGTLTQLNLTGTTIQNDSSGSGFLIETKGPSGSSEAATVQIEGSSFLNNPGAGVQGDALRNTTLTMNILGNAAPGTNTFTGHDTILLSNGDTGHLVADVRNNTISGTGNGIFVGNAVSTDGLAGGTLSAKIVDNSVTTNAGGANNSISSFLSGGTSHLLIDGNTVVNNGQADAINVITPDDPSGPNFTAIVTNNIVTNGASAANGIDLQANVSGPGATSVFKVEGNTVNWSASNVNNLDGIFMNQFDPSTMSLEKGAASLSDPAATVLATNNPNVHASGGGPAIEADGTITIVANGTITLPLLAAAGGVAASSPTPGETNLTQAEVNTAVAAAIAQWAHAGASAAQLAMLSAITFTVADLAGDTIADQSPGHITIDINADGHGWFIDPTPNDNSEFTHAQNAAGTDLLTDPSNAAAGHLDLLTAVAHEMGHELGLPDINAPADDLMYINLVDGERRLPDATDVAQADHDLVQAIEAALPASAQAATSAPIVVGTPGNDTINAGLGGKILLGGGGADNFVFGPDIHPGSATAPAAQPITHVADYSAAQGDSFDFSALTTAFHYSGIADNSLVRAVEDSSGTFATLQLNTTPDQPAARGAAPQASVPNWVNVAQLDGAHAGDAVNVLLDSHLAVHAAQIHVDLLV